MAKPFSIMAMPSYRHVVDLNDLSRSIWNIPCGQSGHIGSPHYDDCFQDFVQGKYRPMLWKKEAIDENIKATLKLKK